MPAKTRPGRRRLSVFDLPEVDPSVFTRRKRFSSVYQGGSQYGQCLPSQQTRLTSQLRCQDWDRYGWRGPMDSARSRNHSIFLTRNPSDLGREMTSSSLNVLQSKTETSLPITHLSLPALPTNGSGDPMLRRPTVKQVKPVAENGDVFKMITKGKDLKPFSFRGDEVKTIEFYHTHYPLLLGKYSESTDIESGPATKGGITEKQVRERLKCSTADRRVAKLRQRARDSDERLVVLERLPDGDGMVTELKDPTFNPLLWPWNRTLYRMASSSLGIP